MRRAAVSIGSDIAEGCGRRGTRELLAYLYIAMGSASELAFQCELALDLGFCTPADAVRAMREVIRVKRMPASLIKAIRTRPVRRMEA